MNPYVIPLPKLSFDKTALSDLFNSLDFNNRWDDRPTGRYIRANPPENYNSISCVKHVNDQLPYSVNWQFIKIIKDWRMPIHIDTYRTAVLTIPLSDDIYAHIQDGIPYILNAAIPHDTHTQNGIDRNTIQIGMANIDTGPFLSWDKVFEKVKNLT